MKSIVLDTNAYSNLMVGSESVMNAMAESDTVYMSIFVLGELYAGFKGGCKEKQNHTILDNLLRKPSVKILNATRETAEIFAEIKNTLRNNGTPIPINDIWIAAHTIESGSVLVTFDGHFNAICGLRTCKWQ